MMNNKGGLAYARVCVHIVIYLFFFLAETDNNIKIVILVNVPLFQPSSSHHHTHMKVCQSAIITSISFEFKNPDDVIKYKVKVVSLCVMRARASRRLVILGTILCVYIYICICVRVFTPCPVTYIRFAVDIDGGSGVLSAILFFAFSASHKRSEQYPENRFYSLVYYIPRIDNPGEPTLVIRIATRVKYI